MLIPHLHFDGQCAEAIALYEKAFQTEMNPESIAYADDGKMIDHAAMEIHGATVYLNDALAYLQDAFGDIPCQAHLILTFRTADELLACYETLRREGESNPFCEAPYSELTGNFVDRFGVLWGFMVAA